MRKKSSSNSLQRKCLIAEIVIAVAMVLALGASIVFNFASSNIFLGVEICSFIVIISLLYRNELNIYDINLLEKLLLKIIYLVYN